MWYSFLCLCKAIKCKKKKKKQSFLLRFDTKVKFKEKYVPAESEFSLRKSNGLQSSRAPVQVF